MKYDPDAQLRALALKGDELDREANDDLKRTMAEVRAHLDKIEGPDPDWVRLFEAKASYESLKFASKESLRKMLREARAKGSTPEHIATLVDLLNKPQAKD